MKTDFRIASTLLLAALLGGCANTSSRQQVLAAGSQVEVRSYQTRSYDTADKIRVLRAVMSTLQDLRFVIDKADATVGIVSATKLDGYALTMSVTVRPQGEQTVVRANAQYNLKAIEQPGPYQDFFAALDKGLFLGDNLQAENVATQTGTAKRADTRTAASAADVYGFYGEAEAEIGTARQDSDLWARALVEVEGDEEKRKARYIRLRAEQLHADQRAARRLTPVKPVVASIVKPSLKSAPSASGLPAIDISGTYESRITSNSQAIFGKRYRHLRLTIEQSGNRISARDHRYDTRLVGEIDGDMVRFEVENGTASGHYAARGQWKIENGGDALHGEWRTHGGWTDAGGKWNLLRIN